MQFNQRKGRGGRGRGQAPGRDAGAARRNRPKWNAGNKDADEEEKQDDDTNLGVFEDRLENEVSLLDANVSSQRYVVSSKSNNNNPEAVTLALNLFASDSGTLLKEMNYALKHLSLQDRYRIPARLISTMTGDDVPDDDSTVLSALSSVTEKLRVAHVLADPVASRLGIQNLPAQPVPVSRREVQREVQPPKKSGRISLLGVTTSPSINIEDPSSSKRTTLPVLEESRDMDAPEPSFGASQAHAEDDEDPTADLIMRLRSLPSQDQNDVPLVGTTSSHEDDDIDEWLKETLNSKNTSSSVNGVEANVKEEETFDEEHLEDWLDSII